MQTETSIPDKQLFLVCEVAKLTGFTAATIRRWARLGWIEHKHFPKQIKIPLSEVKRIIANGVTQTHK